MSASDSVSDHTATAVIPVIRCHCGRYYEVSIPAAVLIGGQATVCPVVLKCRHAGVLQIFDNEVNATLLCAFMLVSKWTKAHSKVVIV